MDQNHISFRPELVAASAFIASTAIVRGNVTFGEHASVWFGAVVRGDTEAIRVGAQSNIQDLCVLHADPGFPCVLGERVTVGHGAIVHGAIVEEVCLIGMRAVVINGAHIGRGSIIAVGAVVTEGVVIPPGSVVMGTPGKVVRTAGPADQARILHAAQHYVDAAALYRASADSQR